MKFGLRTPSLKRSFKARTTGKWKRKLKRTINPFYGKKGMGFIRNPKRAVYNKVYHRTTFGLSDLFKPSSKKRKVVIRTPNISPNITPDVSKITVHNVVSNQKNKWLALVLCLFLGVVGGHKFYEGDISKGVLYLFTGGLFGIGVIIDFITLLFKPNPYYV